MFIYRHEWWYVEYDNENVDDNDDNGYSYINIIYNWGCDPLQEGAPPPPPPPPNVKWAYPVE